MIVLLGSKDEFWLRWLVDMDPKVFRNDLSSWLDFWVLMKLSLTMVIFRSRRPLIGDLMIQKVCNVIFSQCTFLIYFFRFRRISRIHLGIWLNFSIDVSAALMVLHWVHEVMILMVEKKDIGLCICMVGVSITKKETIFESYRVMHRTGVGGVATAGLGHSHDHKKSIAFA